MKSILDIEVSCFRDYDTPYNPRNVNLLKWLQSDKYKDQIQHIRQLSDKSARDALKAKLPAITPGGIFTYRAKKNLVCHTGFIVLDIDPDAQNRQISNWNDLPAQMANIPNIAYFGLSAGGRGYFGLIPIKPDPSLHKLYFDHLRLIFNQLGVNLDPSGSDVSRLRGYSYDPQAYFNHAAIRLDPPPQKPVKTAANASNKPTENRQGYKEVTDHTQARETGLKQIKYLIDQITATPGHPRLLAAARLFGGFVGMGIFTEAEAVEILQKLTNENSYLGSDPEKLESYLKTVIDGIEHGKKNPIYPSEKETEPPPTNWTKYLPPDKPNGFDDFRTYTKGWEVNENGLIINNYGYPAIWDTTPQYKYIDRATKNYIEIVSGYLSD